jgi:hypothetical protein
LGARIGGGAGARAPRAGSGCATPWAGPSTHCSLSLASNRDRSTNQKPKLDKHVIKHNIRQNKYSLA